LISIRFYEPADAPRVVEAARESTAEVFPWMSWCHPAYSLEESAAFIAAQIEARKSGSAFEFAIFEGERILGGCGLNTINPLHRIANLGYWVRTSAAGRGVAPAAVRLLAAWGFGNTALERFEIVAAVGNTRSQRVAEKSGAQREGVLRARLFLHGKPHDAVVYSLVRSEAAEFRPDPRAGVAASPR
jgi:RimJ/RimL family protein N-acetyltransferase